MEIQLPWEITQERRIEAQFSNASALRVAAELEAFWHGYVAELERTSRKPGGRETAVETSLRRKHRLRKVSPIDYDPGFGPPAVAVLGDTVVMTHHALNSWGSLPGYLAALGAIIKEASGVVIQIWARVMFVSPRSALSRELDSWVECGPGFTIAPWGTVIGEPDDRRARPFEGGVELVQPILVEHVREFVDWHVEAGHSLELRVATDADLGRSGALRRAVRAQLDTFTWSDAAIALVERLRAATGSVVSQQWWPGLDATEWICRVVEHLEREQPHTTAASLCAVDVATFDPVASLLSELSTEQTALLDREVPTDVEIGGKLRPVRYPQGWQGEVDLPILDSQGVTELPICGVKLTARLLGPGGHCVAQTPDLPYFWRVMYNDWFREMLVATFPKVDWPPVQPR